MRWCWRSLSSLFAGGRVGRLKDLDLRAVWAFLPAAVVRVALGRAGREGLGRRGEIGPWTSIASYLVLLFAFWLNRHLEPLQMVALGVL